MAKAEPDFAANAYLRAKAIWKGLPPRRRTKVRVGADQEHLLPFGRGRDPRVLGELLASAAREMGWTEELDQAKLFADWPRFVGEVMAQHAQIVGVSNNVLVVQCDSTTWATELRRLRGEILSRILDEYPEVGIRDLRFLQPGAPSWRHGSRSVPGRGPRDTYG